MSIKSICILALCVLIQDGYGKCPTKISGGSKTFVRYYPSMISVRHRDEHVCGGVLIAPEYVLTAAHCASKDNIFHQDIDKHPISTMSVASETDNCYYPTKIHKVRNVTIHPHYRGLSDDYFNDIAVIELTRPIMLDMSHKIANLTNVDITSGIDCEVVGWGTSYENATKLSDFLKKAEVVTISNDECESRTHEFVHDGQLCAAQPWGVGVCDGDSGSPLYIRPGELAGIVSKSYGCGKGVPDVYTRILYYRNWIRKVMR